MLFFAFWEPPFRFAIASFISIASPVLDDNQDYRFHDGRAPLDFSDIELEEQSLKFLQFIDITREFLPDIASQKIKQILRNPDRVPKRETNASAVYSWLSNTRSYQISIKQSNGISIARSND